ncbi:MAG: DUF2007 domain-containing protein [Thiolinea sp.]
MRAPVKLVTTAACRAPKTSTPQDLCHETIYRAANITEAHLVAGMLEAQGIAAHVGGHYLQGGVGEIATMDFARVWVADEDYEAARPLIAEYKTGHRRPA